MVVQLREPRKQRGREVRSGAEPECRADAASPFSSPGARVLPRAFASMRSRAAPMLPRIPRQVKAQGARAVSPPIRPYAFPK